MSKNGFRLESLTSWARRAGMKGVNCDIVPDETLKSETERY